MLNLSNHMKWHHRFNSAGIYVVMFFEILLTLVRVLIVFCVLIIAFGLSFYILLTKVGSNLQDTAKPR